MQKPLKYQRGFPNKPGYWFVWPDEGHWLNGSTKPRVCLVKKGDGIGVDEESLFIKGFPDHEHQTEAYLFKGRVAEPILEPTA